MHAAIGPAGRPGGARARSDRRATITWTRFRRKVERLCAGLRTIDGFRVSRPAGTFYVFPDVRAVCNRLRITSHGLALYLLEGADDHFGVACLGGECFGEAGAGFLRFSCAEPDERIDEAIEFLPKALERGDRVRRYLEANPQYVLRQLVSDCAEGSADQSNDVNAVSIRSVRHQGSLRRRPPDGVSRNRWASAVRHLRRVDPHLRAIIDRIGPCRLRAVPRPFRRARPLDRRPADLVQGRRVDPPAARRAGRRATPTRRG